MKTYDIYAKQNGKWQRKGIQGEPTLPEYDGTVIIEKAIPTIKAGTYKFKDIVEPISTLNSMEELTSGDFIERHPLNFTTQSVDVNGEPDESLNFDNITAYALNLTVEGVVYQNFMELCYCVGEDNYPVYMNGTTIENGQTVTIEHRWDNETIGNQYITVPYDQTVSEIFFVWFNSNTEEVSV